MWKNMGINSSWNARIDDTMVVESIVMTTCMSPFSKPLLNFNQCQKFPPSKTCLSANVVHAFLYKAISPSK